MNAREKLLAMRGVAQRLADDLYAAADAGNYESYDAAVSRACANLDYLRAQGFPSFAEVQTTQPKPRTR